MDLTSVDNWLYPINHIYNMWMSLSYKNESNVVNKDNNQLSALEEGTYYKHPETVEKMHDDLTSVEEGVYHTLNKHTITFLPTGDNNWIAIYN
jgi:hypothetical protein